MRTLGIFVDRQTLSSSRKLAQLMKCREAAEAKGVRSYFLFPVDLKKVVRMDALFIRSRTDPLNVTYVAARLAEMNSIPVIDESSAIRVCSDKVDLGMHLQKAGVCIPRTEFLWRGRHADPAEMHYPFVLKEPSSFNANRVRVVRTPAEARRLMASWFRLSNVLVAQEYISGGEEFRVGTLGGELLYACRYGPPTEEARMHALSLEEVPYFESVCIPRRELPEGVLREAVRASASIGEGLFSVDIKVQDDRPYVLDVNDNPSLESGEDTFYPDIYGRIVDHLFRR
jgi:glutathione synthase/RimK-type ligase-like ATP-grasp enzyme